MAISTGKPRLTYVEIDSVDATDYLVSWDQEENFGDTIGTITLVLNYAVTNSILINGEGDIGLSVTVQRGVSSATEEYVFRGEITEISYQGSTVVLQCSDKLYQAVRSEVNYSFDADIDTYAGKISELFIDIISDYTDLTADSTSVQDSGTTFTLEKYICNHADVFERLQDLEHALDWQMYYNPNTDKVVFEPKGFTSDATVLNIATNIIEVPSWKFDASKLTNKLTLIGTEQEVETTESGQIGVTSGYTTSQVALTKTPVSTKVYVENANPPTVLKTGGKTGSTSTYDYSIDKENKLIVWNTDEFTPGGADFVEIRYSYMLPTPVVKKSQASIDAYNLHENTIFKNDLRTMDDAEQYVNNIIDKYKEPFVSATLKVTNITGVHAGQKVKCIDAQNGIDKWVILTKIKKSWPYKYDEITAGDRAWKEAEWQQNTMDRIRRLEEQASQNQDLLLNIIDLSGDDRFNVYDRRYLQVTKKTYPDPSTDVFILGSYKYGVLGTNKLGDSTGVTASTVRVIQNANHYYEDFHDDDFKDSSGANWDNSNKKLSYT